MFFLLTCPVLTQEAICDTIAIRQQFHYDTIHTTEILLRYDTYDSNSITILYIRQQFYYDTIHTTAIILRYDTYDKIGASKTRGDPLRRRALPRREYVAFCNRNGICINTRVGLGYLFKSVTLY
jgi:hypothetical protein